MACPRSAVELLEWLSSTLVAAFTDDARRWADVTLSRADDRRLRTLLAWLRRQGHVHADAFPALGPPVERSHARQPRGRFPRGRCVVCQRMVAVRADGKARFHRGSEVCRHGGQDIETPDAAVGK